MKTKERIEYLERHGFKIQYASDGAITITGPAIQYARVQAIASGLALEINAPGLKAGRGSLVKAANAITGGSKTTKVGALQDLHDGMTEHVPNYRPLPSVVKALGLVPAREVNIGDRITVTGHGPGVVRAMENNDARVTLIVKLRTDRGREVSGFQYMPDELVAVKPRG